MVLPVPILDDNSDDTSPVSEKKETGSRRKSNRYISQDKQNMVEDDEDYNNVSMRSDMGEKRYAGVLEDLSPSRERKSVSENKSYNFMVSKKPENLQQDTDLSPSKMNSSYENKSFSFTPSRKLENPVQPVIQQNADLSPSKIKLMDYVNENEDDFNNVAQDLSPNRYISKKNPSIDEKLMENGYNPQGYIINENDDGIKICNYVKANDNKGHVVFIEPDVTGHIKLNPNTTVLSEMKNESNIPHSLKVGSLNVVTPDINGVAWECDGEICIISREGEEQNPVEKSFSNVDNQSMNLDHHSYNNTIAYPVIKMSEILENGSIVQETVEDVYTRLRRVDLEQCDYKLEQLKAGNNQGIEKRQVALIHFSKKVYLATLYVIHISYILFTL